MLLLTKLHAAAVQSVESMRGTFQQEMHNLKAERSQLREALHDVKWAASQAAGPNQAAVSACRGFPTSSSPCLFYTCHCCTQGAVTEAAGPGSPESPKSSLIFACLAAGIKLRFFARFCSLIKGPVSATACTKAQLDCCLVHDTVALRGPSMRLQSQAKQPRVCASYEK